MLLQLGYRRCFASVVHAQTESVTYFLADACHGVGFTLAKSILGKSPMTKLAAATQSTACAQEFKNAFWDGDRLITSSFDLTDQRQLENFVSRSKYSLGDDVQVLLANVGELPSRWQRQFLTTPLIGDTIASEWIRLCKDVAAVGILLKTILPSMMAAPTLIGRRKVVAIFSHQSPRASAVNAVAFKVANAALDELVRSTSVELARNAAQSEFVVVKVSTSILADRGAQLEWCTEVSKQIDRLRKDESFALQYDGQSLPIPGYPAQIDTFGYDSNVM